MTFMEKLRGLLDQGVVVSKDIATKAGAKVHELGEKSVLKLEIAQLESQIHKQIAKLGAEAYEAFSERDQPSVSRDSPAIKALLNDIASLKDSIEKRESELNLSTKKSD